MLVVQALVAVAWSDGTVQALEETVIDGLLCGFDATEEDELILRSWARTRRSLDELDLSGLAPQERSLLLSNAALLTHADGEQTPAERRSLATLVERLGLGEQESSRILRAVARGPRPSQPPAVAPHGPDRR